LIHALAVWSSSRINSNVTPRRRQTTGEPRTTSGNGTSHLVERSGARSRSTFRFVYPPAARLLLRRPDPGPEAPCRTWRQADARVRPGRLVARARRSRIRGSPCEPSCSRSGRSPQGERDLHCIWIACLFGRSIPLCPSYLLAWGPGFSRSARDPLAVQCANARIFSFPRRRKLFKKR